MTDDDQKIIDGTIILFTNAGWIVTSNQSSGIQFTKKHQPDIFLILLGIITLPICVGVFFLLAAFLGKDRVVFVTIDQMKANQSQQIMTGSLAIPPTPRG